MPTPFSSDDLGRLFDGRVLTRGRTLVLLGGVKVSLDGDAVKGVVEDKGRRLATAVLPSVLGSRVVFANECACGARDCAHLAATGLAALDRFPALRRSEQRSFFDRLTAENPTSERERLVIDLAPAEAPNACTLSFALVGERTGRSAPTCPRDVAADLTRGEEARAIARLAGGGSASRVAVPMALAAQTLGRLARSGLGRLEVTGKRLTVGGERSFDAGSTPNLPPNSAVLLSDTGPWYVDGATGAVGPICIRRAAAPPTAEPDPPLRRMAGDRGGRASGSGPSTADPVILERTLTPVLRLTRVQAPDDSGRPQPLDALTVTFDYGGAATHADDERQFLRADGPGGPGFVRRDIAAEAAALEMLRPDGFVQMRIADKASAKGRRAFLFRGREAGEDWHHFITERIPALEALGWRSLIDRGFGPQRVDAVGDCDVRVADAGPDGFSLDFGIDIEGKREPLLPILNHLLARGGIEAAHIVGDDLITSLDDGRVVKLPAERIRRLLAIMGDLIDAAERTSDGALLLPDAEAPTVLDLEDFLATRWGDAARIQAYAEQFRDADFPSVALPSYFTGVLRPYQQHGVDWLQHLRAHGLSGLLADDMGLGKTAQTIAHIAVEHHAGRLDRPALIVVPTSLVPNWTAELTKFAPHLRVMVLHGLDRHERRGQIAACHVVITTYAVLARDVEEMQGRPWHVVVLDEAQAIKSPDAKATRAVCQLEARHRLCLSGTPIENNLDELWSQFAFLMPGLLGTRRDFTKRFRTPIEKKDSEVRRVQLVRRIRPFILRRTKAEVATELPAKHTILRRITLAPEQRELYETIRVTLHDRVREQVAARSLAQSRIVMLDALLKLRQACCDPRLVKLPSARLVETSSKLDDLMEMLEEMIPEGRRILVFSQFTSMLDLIGPRLTQAAIPYVELRGDTRDREKPVAAFQAEQVPVFLISLKAGGRGLNLTAADTVIHYDPWWNPAAEDQASDRAHRIGQTKSVFVFKLIAADTVEERILDLQRRKASLANLAFSSEADMEAMGFEDIEYLFGAGEEREAA